jgi:hypothetical protein
MLDAALQQAASYIVESTTTAAVNEDHRKRPTTTTPTPPDEPPTSTNFSSAPGFTINLSDICLPSSTIKLLDKGLTFIPTYNRQPLNQIYDLQHRLVRNLMLKDFFSRRKHDSELDADAEDGLRQFRLPSTWIPPHSKISEETRTTTRDIYRATERLVNKRHSNNYGYLRLLNQRQNTSTIERQAIRDLKSQHEIVIKPADKGSAVVIMNRANYIQEGYRQLNNTQYYRKLTTPIYPNNVPKINAILQTMYDNGAIDDRQLAFLSAKHTDRGRRFYMLPKIHKPVEKWSQPGKMPEGRPIVSDSGSESCRVASFINYHLRPVSTRHPAYLKDTFDFVNKIRGQNVPRGSLLVTADVTSLYTNMTIDRMLETVADAFRRFPCTDRPDKELLDLLELTLRNNDFTFNGELFLQVCGTAMGKSYAPSLADLYLESFDESARTGFRTRPLIYFRYIDDVFMVWTGTVEDLREFETFCNNLIPGIQINFEHSPSSVNFLDTTVYFADLDANTRSLETRIFFKPTDTHQLLEKQSFHPPHCYKGVLKSQFIRFKRISSTKMDYDATSNILMKALAIRHYGRRMMRKVKNDVWMDNTNLASKPTDDREILPVVVPFNELGCQLGRTWRGIINRNSTFRNHRVITAYTVGNNLCKTLVSSTLQEAPQTTTNRRNTSVGQLPITAYFKPLEPAAKPSVSSTNICTPCWGSHCLACSSVQKTSRFRSHATGQEFNVRGRLTCRSQNIIYLISCRRCHLQYVGETSRCLADRLNDHRSYIRTNKTTPTGAHFRLPHHSSNDVIITGIEQLQSTATATYRRIREQAWIALLQTWHPHGINHPSTYRGSKSTTVPQR